MNIFYVDRNANSAAQALVDKHVVKMVLETAQLLSTAHRVLDGDPLPDGRENHLYKATHINHPSSKWVRQSNNNYNWLFAHFLALLDEYTYRYEKEHKCAGLVRYLMVPPKNIPSGYFTPPTCAMDEQYKISNDALENYRYYYNEGKKHLHSWKKRPVPHWIY